MKPLTRDFADEGQHFSNSYSNTRHLLFGYLMSFAMRIRFCNEGSFQPRSIAHARQIAYLFALQRNRNHGMKITMKAAGVRIPRNIVSEDAVSKPRMHKPMTTSVQ